jgi:hypothetical protein
MRFTDQEELARRRALRQRQRRRDIFWNVLTALVVLATLAVVGYFLLIFADPQLPLNPFPPPTMPVLIVRSTSTPTQPRLPATWTPTPRPTETVRPTQTDTPEPTETVAAAATVTPFATSATLGDYPFAPEGNPVAMPNNAIHSGEGCDWQGVGGKIVDIQGRHLSGILIRLSGFYNGETIDMTAISGGASAWYGESGYEFYLGDTPLESFGTLYVQMLDQSLRPLSDRVVFNTFDTCDKNLILINFKQVR